MKRVLLGILTICLLSMCSNEEEIVDTRTDEQIALELLFSDGFARRVKRANSYRCESSELFTRGADIDDVVYQIQFNNDGSYLLTILYSDPVIINGRLIYREKEGDNYRFENTYEYENPANPTTSRHPIISEGSYVVYFDDLPRSNRGYFEMISDECVNSAKQGFEFSYR